MVSEVSAMFVLKMIFRQCSGAGSKTAFWSSELSAPYSGRMIAPGTCERESLRGR